MAFSDRGGGDFYASHDLEDFIAVIDGREDTAAEIDAALALAALRGYFIGSVRGLAENSAFQEALPGHLTGDTASQRRLPGLRSKLRAIAAMRLS